MAQCSQEVIDQLIADGILSFSNLHIHKRKRLVYAQDVQRYIDTKNDIPITNIPARNGVPNILLLMLPKQIPLPVPMIPQKKILCLCFPETEWIPFLCREGEKKATLRPHWRSKVRHLFL